MFHRGSSSKSLGSHASGGPAPSSSHPLSLCADCGASPASWASINLGVLLCADCTSVHRSLGRHISHVKSLAKGQWIPEQLNMVRSLYSCGANSIWEYSLLNPGGSSSKGGRRKPQPTDPLHPVKGDFISSKYQQQQFVYRPAKDEPAVTESELSRQLHSSVRTPNLETSLRLISQGADTNYFHPEKNSTPLQVAARAGQAYQVELLLVYGADPGAVDKNGRTASEYARQSGHTTLGARIANAQFELSDRLSFFLCQRRPDHAGAGSQESHFLVPEIDHDRHAEDRRVAKRRLQGLNNSVFEELAMDVYDEVDRRETDAIWNAVESSSSKKSAVVLPFLPVNPDYGTTRNQGRQKLARLNAKEFAILVMDVLKEIRRRQTDMNSRFQPANKMPSPLRETPPGMMKGAAKVGQTKSLPVVQRIGPMSMVSDDEPIYDHVASDDDYYHIPESDEKDSDTMPKRPHSSSGPSRQDTTATSSSITSSPSKSNSSSRGLSAVPPPLQQGKEFQQLRTQLENSEVKVQKLIESNDDMRGEIARLSMTVNKLVSENEQLRVSMSPTHSFNNVNNRGSGQQLGTAGMIRGDGSLPYADSSSTSNVSQNNRAFDARSSPGPTSMPHSGANYMTLPSRYAPGRSNQPQQSHSHYYDPYELNNSDGQQGNSSSLPYTLPPQQPPPPPAPETSAQQQDYLDPREMSPSTSSVRSLPSQEEVVRRTEAITRCIQELLISAKDEHFEAFIPCSERIVRAVTDMVVLFPDEPLDPGVSASLSSLTAAATHFENECRILIVRSQSEPLNQSFVTQQVIQCAFDIAKSTKQLVALFQ